MMTDNHVFRLVMLRNEDWKLNDAHELACSSESGQLSSTLLIDSEIQRYAAPWRPDSRSAILKFTADIEHRFEADTRTTRIRELRITTTLAVGFYLITSITDSVFVPDLGMTGLLMRIVAALLLLFTIAVAPRLSGWLRETLIAFAAIVAIIVLATVPAISSAPLAPFAFDTISIAVIYANTTLPLRFKYACTCSAICGGVAILELFIHTRIGFDQSWAMALLLAIASVYSLITSYRIERGVRLNYLLASREALRLSLLSADREILTTLSNTDALTDLVNRRHFDHQSAAIFADPKNDGTEAALLFIDVDHFKRYNDYYGHPAGDACLRAVAGAVSGALHGTNNLTARYGGEEFAILLLDVKKREAELIAKRVCKAVSALDMLHLNRSDSTRIVTISVGVARGVIGEHLTIDSLIESADTALYAAKRGGRNRVEFRLTEAA